MGILRVVPNSGKPKHEVEKLRRMCLGKIGSTKEQAKNRVKRAAKKGVCVQAYRCPNCHGYHITTQVRKIEPGKKHWWLKPTK